MAKINFVTKDNLLYVWQKLKVLLSNKVDKVEGKGLSTNDLTDELKNKILNAGDSSFSGNYSDLINKPDLTVYATKTGVTTDIATAIANFLTEAEIDTKISTATKNMSTTTSVATAISTALIDYYTKTEIDTTLAEYAKSAEVTTAITNALKTYYTKTQVDTAITNATKNFITSTDIDTKITTATKNFLTGTQIDAKIGDAVKDITSIDYSIVTELPTTGVKGTIYLMSNNGLAPNIYDEYIYVNNKFEKIGTTEIDLSGYIKKIDLVAVTNQEIDEIFAS